MILKHLAAVACMLPLVVFPAVGAAQAASPTAPTHRATSAPAASAPASQPASGSDSSGTSSNPCQGPGCDNAQPHITIATPAPAASPWPLQERISWIANILMVLYVIGGVTLAYFLLRKIERQSHYAETAAQAAADSAKAALLFAEGQARSERPWFVASAEPSTSAPDSFQVIVTNRGRSPARIVALVDEIAIATDESQMPARPFYKNEPEPPRIPIILLTGESAAIKTFSRAEVASVCESPEQLRMVENWESKIYLYGNIVYAELLSGDKEIIHETGWCCWYIHGRQKSGLVMAGPREYNQHT